MLQTRNNEIRIKTSNSKEMLGKFLAEDLRRVWKEDFVDESNAEVVTIDRYETVAERGSLINGDLLQSISFFLQSGDIKEVEVSDQKREAFLIKNEHLFPWISTVKLGGKKKKYLLYASTIEMAIEILKDYIELNDAGGFSFSSFKEFESSIILKDNLSQINDEEIQKDVVKKFYQIEVIVTNEDGEYTSSFVVETKDVDKAMMIITDYVIEQSKDREIIANEDSINIKLETAKILPCDYFIEKEFSLAYSEK